MREGEFEEWIRLTPEERFERIKNSEEYKWVTRTDDFCERIIRAGFLAALSNIKFQEIKIKEEREQE